MPVHIKGLSMHVIGIVTLDGYSGVYEHVIDAAVHMNGLAACFSET